MKRGERTNPVWGVLLAPFVVSAGLLSACGAIDEQQKAEAREQAEATLRDAQQKLDAAAREAKAKIDEKRPEVERQLGELREDAEGQVARAKANLEEATSYAPIEGADAAISCDGEICHVDKSFAARFAEHPEWLAREVKIAPAFRRGAIYGLRVAYVHDGSIVDLLGLRAGDVVTTVDGKALTSVAELQALSQQDRANPRDIVVEYERGASPRKLVLRQR